MAGVEAMGRAGYIGDVTREPGRVWAQAGPELGLNFCCHHLEILNNFIFDFCSVNEVGWTMEHVVSREMGAMCPFIVLAAPFRYSIQVAP